VTMTKTLSLLLLGVSMTTTSFASRGTPAPPSVESIVSSADLIVEGDVTKSNGVSFSARVTKVLKGTSTETTLAIHGTAPARHDHQVLAIGPAPKHELLGSAESGLNRRNVTRVVNGLPAYDQLPRSTELKVLFGQADIVAYGELIGTSITEGKFRKIDLLKGALPDDSVVLRGDVPNPPGGPWELVPGRVWRCVLFLDSTTKGLKIINPTDPTVYIRSLVVRALAKK
jgi:hypothetical protein